MDVCVDVCACTCINPMQFSTVIAVVKIVQNVVKRERVEGEGC